MWRWWGTKVRALVWARGQRHRAHGGLTRVAVDLEHMRAVTRRKQEQFATENDMFVFEVSAKTGYRVRVAAAARRGRGILLTLPRGRLQVGKVFQRVAADLSGMALTRKQVEAATNIVHAEVVQVRASAQRRQGRQARRALTCKPPAVPATRPCRARHRAAQVQAVRHLVTWAPLPLWPARGRRVAGACPSRGIAASQC